MNRESIREIRRSRIICLFSLMYSAKNLRDLRDLREKKRELFRTDLR